MITDEQAEAAADFIRDKADEYAQAHADLVTVENGKKALKAMLMKEHADKALGVQEREAMASDRMKTLHKAEAEATFKVRKLQSLMKAAEIRIEVWRSQSANNRGRL